jgi:hypothetical protein
MVFNPYDDSILELEPQEVRSLIDGKPLPLIGYLAGAQPTRRNENIIAGLPTTKPPQALVEAIRGFVKGNPELLGYDLFQMYNEERDIKPHLALNLLAKKGAPEVQLAQDMHRAMLDHIPKGEYVDIMFNYGLPVGFPDGESYRKGQAHEGNRRCARSQSLVPSET